MIFRAHKNYRYLKLKNPEENQEKAEIENTINLKILDAILEDDDDQFSQLISENIQDPSKCNKTFFITNYKMPNVLKGNPTYASLCAYFCAEKCFTALSLFLPDGTASEEMKKLDDFKRSPIHFACIGGSLNILRELSQAMFDINARDESGYFPSHYAAMAGHFDIIKYLWTKGANLTSPSYNNNMTPLQVACFYGNLDIVKFLCETVITNNNCTEPKLNGNIDFLINFLSIGKEPTPLHYACKGGHDNIVKYFLTKPDLINLQITSLDKNSRNPLLCACHNGSLNCVKALLEGAENKIKLNMKGRKHLPLVDAAAGGYLDIVQYLLKQKQVKIQQETSENISALHAAVMNDHLNVVKLLIHNGASTNLPKDKIGHIFFSALKIENFELIRYLDSVLEIPYKDKYQVEQTTKKTSIRYKIAVAENESKNLTYGDLYMQQACYLENKEMIQFLLDKNCSLDFVDISKIVSEKTFPFIQFLIEKGFDLSCSKNPTIEPPIVKLIRSGDLNMIEKFISLGAVLNSEIILKYRCLEFSIGSEKYQIFNYLMKYKPDLQQDKATELFRIAFDHSFQRYRSYLADYGYNTMETLLNNYKIDLNSGYKNKYSNASFVSVAAEKKDFKSLGLFDKYGADFKNCPLRFESMISVDYLPVYSFLRDRGCKFDKRVIDKSSDNTDRIHLCPLHKVFRCFLFNSLVSPDVIIFLLDFATKEQIVNAKFLGCNLTDFFMKRDCLAGIIKVFTLVNGIIYPSTNNTQYFNKWVFSTNNLPLINTVFNSGLKAIQCGDDIEYDDDDSDDSSYDDFLFFNSFF